MKFFRQLSSRITLLLLLVALVPTSILQFINYQKTKGELLRLSGEELLSSTFLLARDLDRLLEQRSIEIKVISQADVFEQNDTDKIQQYIEEIDKESAFLSGIQVLDLNHEVLAHSGDSKESIEHWPENALSLLHQASLGKQGQVFFAEAFLFEQNQLLKIISPITDDSNTQVIKLLVTSVNTQQISTIVSEFDENIGGEIPVQIIDNFGMVIFSSDHSLIAQPFAGLSFHPALLDDLAVQHQNVVREYVNHQRKNVIAGFADMSEFGENQGLDWSIYAAAPRAEVLLSLEPILRLSLFFSAAVVLIVLASGYVISYNVSKPIAQLTRFTEDSDIKVDNIKGAEEIEKLRDHMVRSKSYLEQLNQGLELAVEKRTTELQQSRNQMIEQEKMASLGRMVAGISHEINTPLGIIVTASTHLNEKTETIIEAFENKSLSPKQLKDFFTVLKESSKIVDSASEKAANLVHSFKQVAVDQSSESLRQVNLKEFMEEVVITLSPRFKNTPYELVTSAPNEQAYIETGALYQIISNLVLNAIIHAFEGLSKGKIRVDLNLNDHHILLVVSDDGIGLDRLQINQLFEPFYTTKRGSGGTGLGTHIVYNLVTQTLKGSIEVKSHPGEGVKFEIKLPLASPEEIAKLT